MSLPTVPGTGAVTGHLDDTVNSVTKGEAPQAVRQPTKKLGETTKGVTGGRVRLPGEYPPDDGQRDQPERNNITVPSFSSMVASVTGWMKSFFPALVDWFESMVERLVLKFFPPPRQAAMYEAALSHPIAATFVVCQLICCGVPILVFLAGTFLFAAVALLLWFVLSLLILGPIMLVAAMLGVSLWGWGWILYGFVKWIDRLFLGGMISRFWIRQALPTQEGQESQEKPSDGPERAEEEKNDE